MTITWGRRHWLTFAVLLACQVLGLYTMARRGAFDGLRIHFKSDWLSTLGGWVTGSAFLTTTILSKLFEAVFPRK
jgi:hypothetical protein